MLTIEEHDAYRRLRTLGRSPYRSVMRAAGGGGLTVDRYAVDGFGAGIVTRLVRTGRAHAIPDEGRQHSGTVMAVADPRFETVAPPGPPPMLGEGPLARARFQFHACAQCARATRWYGGSLPPLPAWSRFTDDHWLETGHHQHHDITAVRHHSAVRGAKELVDVPEEVRVMPGWPPLERCELFRSMTGCAVYLCICCRESSGWLDVYVRGLLPERWRDEHAETRGHRHFQHFSVYRNFGITRTPPGSFADMSRASYARGVHSCDPGPLRDPRPPA